MDPDIQYSMSPKRPLNLITHSLTCMTPGYNCKIYWSNRDVFRPEVVTFYAFTQGWWVVPFILYIVCLLGFWSHKSYSESYWCIMNPHLWLPSHMLCNVWHTVRCRYNMVNFLTNTHKIHPIVRPLGRGMWCLLWIQHVIDILPQFV